MNRQESIYSLIAITAAALVAVLVLGSDGTAITLAQSPLFTPTFTPIPPTPTFTPIPPTPTFTPVPPTPTSDPNGPPICTTARPSVDILWPPNHRLVEIEVLGVTDPEEAVVVITIDNIFQDEPVDSNGDGRFTPDGHGVGTSIAEVRAERDGAGNGRVYHIRFTANDAESGSCSGEVLVGVPKSRDMRGDPVDDGALYDSTVVTRPR